MARRLRSIPRLTSRSTCQPSRLFCQYRCGALFDTASWLRLQRLSRHALVAAHASACCVGTSFVVAHASACCVDTRVDIFFALEKTCRESLDTARKSARATKSAV